MRFGQRFYLIEAVQGVLLTSGHFFRNMGKHIAHALGRGARIGWLAEHKRFRRGGNVATGKAEVVVDVGILPEDHPADVRRRVHHR